MLLDLIGWFSNRQNSIALSRNPGARKPIGIMLRSHHRVEAKIPIGFRAPGFRFNSPESDRIKFRSDNNRMRIRWNSTRFDYRKLWPGLIEIQVTWWTDVNATIAAKWIAFRRSNECVMNGKKQVRQGSLREREGLCFFDNVISSKGDSRRLSRPHAALSVTAWRRKETEKNA